MLLIRTGRQMQIKDIGKKRTFLNLVSIYLSLRNLCSYHSNKGEERDEEKVKEE